MNTLYRAFRSVSRQPAVWRTWKALTYLIPAIYVSRVSVELLFPDPPAALITGFAIGLSLAAIARRLQVTGVPILFLLPTVLWPYQDPRLALTFGILAVATAAFLCGCADRRLADILPLLLGLPLYILTLAPGIQPADGGEFQLVLATWGVAHPPGYPLYTVLGGLFVHVLPIADFAWRANLFSAMIAALTLLVVARVVRRETGNGWAGLAAAATLGTATTFWATATQASIRPLTALFAALMLATALDYRRAVHSGMSAAAHRALLYFGLATGLGVTHHASLLFPGSVLALAILAARPALIREGRHWLPALLAALAGAIPWTYLLIRGAAGAPLAPSDLASWEGFWRHVLATGFAGDMFYYRTPPELLERLQLITQIINFQWQPLTLLLAVLAFVSMIRRDRWLALTLASTFAVHSLVSATYRAPQTVEYMIPAYVCLAMAVGWLSGAGSSISVSGQRQYVAAILMALAMLGAFQSGWTNWISLRLAQERDHTASDARAILEAAPQKSVILANWHQVTPLWYLHTVETLRPDVEVRYVAPAGAESILNTWLRLITEESEQRPVVTCSYYPETFRQARLSFSALETCWRVNPPEAPAAVDSLARFGNYELVSVRFAGKSSAGDHLAVTLNWRLPGPVAYGELASFVHLVDSTGVVLAQDDRPFQAAGTHDAALIAQRHILFLPRTLPPGDYQLLAGIYRPAPEGPLTLPDSEGQSRIVIGQLAVSLSDVPPVTDRPGYAPFSRELRLVGYDYDLSVPGRARLYLHWVVEKEKPGDVWQIIISGPAGELNRQSVSAPGKGYLTTAHDLPDVETVNGLQLRLERDGEVMPLQGILGLPLTDAMRLDGPRSGERYVPVGNVVIVRANAFWQADGQIEVDMTMRSALPLDQDITIKLAYGSQAEMNVPPAGGTIPTLKWGWQTTVATRLSLPIERPAAPSGPLTLTLYDAFTSQAWPVLDPVLGQHSPALILME